MKTLNLTEDLYAYMVGHCPPINPVLGDLRAETAKLSDSQMQISHDQGAFLHLMTGILGAKRIVEIGCYTGYSSICMAANLPEGGKLITLDINPETTAIAQKYWQAAGLADKIELRLGEALPALVELEREFGAQTVDLVFIDADKVNMPDYYEHALRLLRPGGVVIADNVLWSGKVIDDNDSSESTVAIRRLNQKLAEDERVDRVMVPIADGLFICRKR